MILILAIFLSSPSFAHPPSEPTASPELIDGWLNSVVMLQTNGAWCSGVVIDAHQIATAYHCVASGSESLITFRDGRTTFGKSSASYPKSDIAIIKANIPTDINGLGLRSSPPLPGTVVYALGHPLAPHADKKILRGTLRWSVSTGIVSAVGETFVQTDASLNPGNSGGPVVDASGQIVGIASRKLRAENLGFLGPASDLKQLLIEPQPLKWWGGQLAIGGWYGFISEEGASMSAGIQAQYRMRERLIATTGLGTPLFLSGSTSTNNGFVSLGLRQGFGHGSTYATIDLGGSGIALRQPDGIDLTLRPEAYVRLGFAGIGFRYGLIWVDSETMASQTLVDFDILGVIRVF